MLFASLMAGVVLAIAAGAVWSARTLPPRAWSVLALVGGAGAVVASAGAIFLYQALTSAGLGGWAAVSLAVAATGGLAALAAALPEHAAPGAGLAAAALLLSIPLLMRPWPWAPALPPLLGAFVLLGAGAFVPRSAALWAARRARPLVAAPAVILLALVTPLALFVGLLSWSDDPSFSEARHAWTLEIEPEDGGDYVLIVPFVESVEPRGEEALEALRARLRVVSGDAEARLVEDGTAVEVRGRGAVRVEAVHEFREGGIAMREAFHAWGMPARAAEAVAASAPLHVTLRVDLSGGSGHTCWASAEHNATLAPGESVPLADGERRFQAVCA